MYKGTPAKCFFQCVDLVILMQIVQRGAPLKFV